MAWKIRSCDVPVTCSAYNELGDGQVMEALNHHLKAQHFQKEDNGLQGVILFRDAIEHATRLCRLMVSIS